MNFELTEDQKRIRDAVREFAQAEIAPGVAEREKEGALPQRDPRPASARWGSWG